ncbi:hypothetical protein WA538_005516 [Blastocystis sp. DL]
MFVRFCKTSVPSLQLFSATTPLMAQRFFGKKSNGKGKKEKEVIAPESVPTIDFSVVQTDMNKIATYLGNAYTKIQASRFDPRMIEQLKVTMGTQTAVLKSIAQVAARTQISYSITPFDPANAPFLLKALKDSDLNLNPQMDKNSVHIQVPKTTKETRQKLIKQVGAECEQQKGKLRNVRKKYMDRIRVIEKSKTVSKDDVDRMKKKVDSITDGVTKEMNEMMKKKEQELAI